MPATPPASETAILALGFVCAAVILLAGVVLGRAWERQTRRHELRDRNRPS